jgi:chromosome segregation ATPase
MLLTSPFSLSILFTVIVISGFIIFIVNLVSKHNEQIRKYSEQIYDADIACEKLKHQLSAIEKNNIILSRDIDKMQQQHRKYLDKLKPEYRKIYYQLMSTIDKLDIMTSKFHDSEDAFDSLLDDNRELEHELHELSVENLQLRNEIVSLRSKIPGFEPKPTIDTAKQTENNDIPETTVPQSGDRIIGYNSEIINAEIVTFGNAVSGPNDTFQETLPNLDWHQKNNLQFET